MLELGEISLIQTEFRDLLHYLSQPRNVRLCWRTGLRKVNEDQGRSYCRAGAAGERAERVHLDGGLYIDSSWRRRRPIVRHERPVPVSA
jgi:hypothetical protein